MRISAALPNWPSTCAASSLIPLRSAADGANFRPPLSDAPLRCRSRTMLSFSIVGNSSIDWEGLASAACYLLHVMGGAMIFGFMMQWNSGTMELEGLKELKSDWKSGMRIQALLRWYFVTPFVVARRIWRKTNGMRWLVPVGVLLILVGQIVVRLLKPHG